MLGGAAAAVAASQLSLEQSARCASGTPAGQVTDSPFATPRNSVLLHHCMPTSVKAVRQHIDAHKQ